MNLREVQRKLKEIEEMGYVESMRPGSTGIGYTFETLFGVQENNLSIADIEGRVEIKTIRSDSQSLITLFTFNKSVWKIHQKELIKKYGYKDKKDRYALKNTVFFGHPIPQGLKLDINEKNNTIHLVDANTGETIAIWDVYVIVGKFMTKLSRVLLVFADRKKENGREYFHYKEAYLLTDPAARRFINAFKQSIIGIDLRMHLKENGEVRNRGTAFRIKEKDLVKLYDHRKKLL